VVNMSVADAIGRVLQTATINVFQGENSHTVDLSGIASGIYLLRLEGSHVHATSKIVIKD